MARGETLLSLTCKCAKVRSVNLCKRQKEGHFILIPEGFGMVLGLKYVNFLDRGAPESGISKNVVRMVSGGNSANLHLQISPVMYEPRSVQI